MKIESNNARLKTALISFIGALSLPALASEPVIVNTDNFVKVETSIQFERGYNNLLNNNINTIAHFHQPLALDKQNVIRMNRDTLYSNSLIDISKGATVTIPETNGRYLSVMVINEDGYINKVIHGKGTYALTMEEFDTPYVALAVRTLIDASDPVDVQIANDLQKGVKIKANSAIPYSAIKYDESSYQATYEALIALSRGMTTTENMFGSKEHVDPVRHLIGTAFGFAGMSEEEAVYINVEPKLPVGVYQLTVKDVPVDGFWSISVYNESGFFEKNEHDAYTINNLTAAPNEDGSFTINFGGDPDADNYLHIKEGWNYVVRMYLPGAEILDGSWSFPEVSTIN
tara:strand:- start:1016 stop:2047 length:1032 start_codon:yes stop_codon:yes gene_type:complete